MKSFKLDMDVNQAEEILKEVFDESVTQVFSIEMGQLSKVFSFMAKDKCYVVHFRDNEESFIKADYMHRTYGDRLPIPQVVKTGKIDEICFIISDKIKGKAISSYSASDQSIIINDVAKHFTNMSQIKIESSKGFGLISPDGRASHKSWGEVLAEFFREDQDGFYKDWTKLYKQSFLEKSLFQEGYSAMMALSKYSPCTPCLVHGDFHLWNLLSDGNRVTGIVDWELAMYGDFMFDLGVFHLWTPHLDFPRKVRDLWQESGSDIMHFEERLRCHMLFKAIDGLRFYAKQEAKPSYDFIREKVMALLNGNMSVK